ncbi:MAG: TRAM domain-containing protein [Firmicutes bacterium]|nr:TRAM domain-containing protein [Bacillota bacterium]
MLMKILTVLFGLSVGFTCYYLLFSFFPQLHLLIVSACALVGSGVGYLVGNWFLKFLWRKIEDSFQKITVPELIVVGLGMLFGLILSGLIVVTLPVNSLPGPLGNLFALMIILTISGVTTQVSHRKKEEILNYLGTLPKNPEKSWPKGKSTGGKSSYKVLDTSSIIDGRIMDISQTEFLEGILVVPGFVVAELQRIADSSDSLKRNRGRRGLDILNKMQKDPALSIRIYDQDFDELADVDIKIVRLAKLLDAKVITNDYNLNKVAELYGVPVLNINELANAIKPIVLPGEEVTVQVIKDGKEFGQGIAYLEDGTMIVVDGGRQYIGEEIVVTVTSVLQTAAGRMIFAKPKEALVPKASSLS